MIPTSVSFWEEHISPLQADWNELVKLCGRKLKERDARKIDYVAQQNKKYQVICVPDMATCLRTCSHNFNNTV